MYAISDPAVVINNESVNLAPGSVKYTEGLGEQSIRAQSSGGGSVSQVFSDDVSTHFSMCKFELYNTIESISLARKLKTNKNGNTITVTGKDPTTGKKISRTFKQAAICNDYEVQLASDATFELEFKSLPAV